MSALEVREKILLYQSHGFLRQARHALEYLLLNHFEGFQRAEQADFYRYCLVLEQLGEWRYTRRLIEDYLVWHVKPRAPMAGLGVLLQIVLVRVLERLGEEDMALDMAERSLVAMENLTVDPEQAASTLPPRYFPDFHQELIKATITVMISDAHLRRDNCILRRKYLEEAMKLDSFVEEASVWKSNAKVDGLRRYFEEEKYADCVGLVWGLFREPQKLSGLELVSVNEILAACYCQLSRPVELFLLTSRLISRKGEEITVESVREGDDKVRVETPSAGNVYVRGLLAQLKGENENARGLFKRATVIDPYHVPSHLALGHSYAAWGDHEQALACYARIIRKIDETCVAGWIAMAAEFLRVGKVNYAPVYLHEALTLCPDDPGALNELGVYLFARGQLPEALEALQKALTKCGQVSRSSIGRNLLMVQLKLAVSRRNLDDIRSILERSPTRYTAMPLIMELKSYFADDGEEQRFFLARAIDGYSGRADAHKLCHVINHLISMNSNLDK